jgi:hypothetical protein
MSQGESVLTDLPEYNQVQPGTSSFDGYEFEPGISSHPVAGPLTVGQLMCAPLPTVRDTSFARPFVPAMARPVRDSYDSEAGCRCGGCAQSCASGASAIRRPDFSATD